MGNIFSKIELFLLCCVSGLFSFCGVAGQSESVFEKKNFCNRPGDTLYYRLMRPIYNDTTKKYPIVLFLHGAGEKGKDNNSQLVNGALNFASPLNRKIFPCYMIVPQCATGYSWVETDWNLPSHIQPEKPSVYLERTMRLLDSLTKKLNIDTNRIYITGLSMGGFGTWDAISRWPWKFAAAVPVCGGGDTAKASLIKDIPIWAFHGDNDKVVMTSRSRDMIAVIKKSGGNPNYTEYPNIGHNVWNKAYTDTEMYLWLFSQSKENRKK
ncbi:MAG: prolyl oligopeptidase family serine peptidase [Bacteroidales bacterium]